MISQSESLAAGGLFLPGCPSAEITEAALPCQPQGNEDAHAPGSHADTWKQDGRRVELILSKPPDQSCGPAGKYDVAVSGSHVTLTVEDDACTVRRMILDRSTQTTKATMLLRVHSTKASSSASPTRRPGEAPIVTLIATHVDAIVPGGEGASPD